MHSDNADSLVYARIENAEPVLAGTLCLMSAFLNGGCPQLAQKVIHNLTVLSSRPELSDEFRRICLNLRAHWCNECARACAQAQAGTPAQAPEVAVAGAPAPVGQTLH